MFDREILPEARRPDMFHAGIVIVWRYLVSILFDLHSYGIQGK